MFDRIRRLRRGALAGVGVAAAVVFAASCGGDNNASSNNNGQNALRPAGPAAHKILNLFTPFFWVAVVIGVGVVGMTIFVAIRFRERPGEERAPVQVHGNTVLEVSWTIIPFLILMVMAVPTVATIFNLAKVPKGNDVVHVEVAARQWFWQYTYTDSDTGFLTANELHIPVNRPVVLYAHEQQRDPLVLGARAGRQEGRRPRPPQHPHDRSRPHRHLPRPVRRVLRPVARQHAPAGDRAVGVRLGGVGEVAADAALRRQGDRVRQDDLGRVGLPELPLGHQPLRSEEPERSARRSGPTSRTSATGKPSPATSSP